ncbi:MAG: 50S ribosomal protein L18 [Patescibacteria group bacterium]
MISRQIKRQKSHRKIRMEIIGTKVRPRLSVFRSANHIYAQLIDDENGKVLVSVSDIKSKNKKANQPSSKTSARQGKVEQAIGVGKLIAKKAIAQKIEKIVFDRGGFVFHGRIKAVADGAREGGLKF